MALRARDRQVAHGWIDAVATFFVGFAMGVPCGVVIMCCVCLVTCPWDSTNYLTYDYGVFWGMLVGCLGGGMLGGMLLLWLSRHRPRRGVRVRAGCTSPRQERVGSLPPAS